MRLSRRTELPLIAVGVETPKLRQWLARIGFNNFQVFHFARPQEKLPEAGELDPDRAILLDLLQRLDSGVEFEELDRGLASLGLTRAQLQQAQLKAFQWVGHL